MSPSAGAVAPRFSLADKLLFGLLATCVARNWLMVLPSSLWVDEMVTAFVIRRPNDPSFAIAPQVPQSLYYWLPKIASRLLGGSEIALRIPSVLAMGVALYFIARLAARLIAPEARWLALSVCMALSGFAYFAVDARPYALGIAIASASLFFLVRSLDEGRWRDVLWFILTAALLWRVHLFYWPFYLLYAAYGVLRIAKRDAKTSMAQLLVAVAAVSALLAPVVAEALAIHAGASAHVFTAPPGPLEFLIVAEFVEVAICLVVALVFRFACRWKRESPKLEGSSVALILCWWLVCPVCLGAYSVITGNGVLILRYVSLMLPGVAMTITLVVTRLVPPRHWKRAAAAFAFAALAVLGQWYEPWPWHEGEGWRQAAGMERQLATDATPILCPSPFIEALPPVWTPDYHLPGFLYSNLSYYPLRGQASVFPFVESPQSDREEAQLLRTRLIPSGRFIIFGPLTGANYLYRWLEQQPEMASWHARVFRFGAVVLVVYSTTP